SAGTLRKAHAVHPVVAVQTEYSLWTRNPEIGVLAACREIGAALVAFSPIARGFLSAGLRDVDALEPGDIRRGMPRFQGEHLAANLAVVDALAPLAEEAGCTRAQLALAWLLAQGRDIVPIPGTTRPAHLRENVAAAGLRLDPGLLARVGELVNQRTVSGPRYPAATQVEIDTEEFCAPVRPRQRAPDSVAHLAVPAPEGAALAGAQVRELQVAAAFGAFAPAVDLPVPAQDELPLPLQEIEAVRARLGHQLGQLAWRQVADPGAGMHADPEQHFVLDDVADAGEHVLVEQGVAGE